MSRAPKLKENSLPTSEKTISSKEASKRKLEKFMEEELKPVRGIFQFFECPGMSAPVTIKKYPGHFFKMEMRDGEEYTVPLYVARFLNGIDVTAEHIDGKLHTCSYPVHSHVMDKDGNPTISVHKRKKRFGFQSLEFGASSINTPKEV